MNLNHLPNQRYHFTFFLASKKNELKFPLIDHHCQVTNSALKIITTIQPVWFKLFKNKKKKSMQLPLQQHHKTLNTPTTQL